MHCKVRYLLDFDLKIHSGQVCLLQGHHSQFLVFIKQPGLDIWKKSLLNNQYYLFFQIREAWNDQVL